MIVRIKTALTFTGKVGVRGGISTTRPSDRRSRIKSERHLPLIIIERLLRKRLGKDLQVKMRTLEARDISRAHLAKRRASDERSADG
jgi:hypothetical protein